MTSEQALAFVRLHGVVLASAKGPVPNLVEASVGEIVKGSWWAHPQGRQIFRLLQRLYASADILVCRLVGGKITFIHRRLWPALVRVANYFPAERIAQVHEEHTKSGHHVTRSVPFPKWVPPRVAKEARQLAEQEAFASLGDWVRQKGKKSGRPPKKPST